MYFFLLFGTFFIIFWAINIYGGQKIFNGTSFGGHLKELLAVIRVMGVKMFEGQTFLGVKIFENKNGWGSTFSWVNFWGLQFWGSSFLGAYGINNFLGFTNGFPNKLKNIFPNEFLIRFPIGFPNGFQIGFYNVFPNWVLNWFWNWFSNKFSKELWIFSQNKYEKNSQ